MIKSDMSFDSFPEVIFNCITIDPSPKFIQLTEICKPYRDNSDLKVEGCAVLLIL